MRTVRALSALLLSLCALASPSGCNLDNLGDPPPDGDIYFPTGLMLSAQSVDSAPRYLYVVSSNFDLRYNRGSLQAFDLDQLDEKIRACDPPSAECVIDPKSVLVDEVLVPSQSTSLGISPDRSRMYVATRTDPSLLFIDLNESGSGEDVLQCDERERRCSDARRSGMNASESPRGRTIPLEPVGMWTLRVEDAMASPPAEMFGGTFVLIAHRTGHVSLFHDPGSGARPVLVDVFDYGASLLQEPTGIAFDDSTHLAYVTLFNRTVPGDKRLLSRLGIGVQGSGSPEASFIYNSGPLEMDGVAAQADTRGVAVLNAASSPGRLAVLGREPASLLIIDVGPDAAGALPALHVPVEQILNIAAGPTRMALGEIEGRRIVAVSCFDGRALYVVDVESSEVLANVHNLDGPFELGIDNARKRIYLADFRTSTVRVIDLSPLAQKGGSDRTDAPIIATLGIPKVVQELQ